MDKSLTVSRRCLQTGILRNMMNGVAGLKKNTGIMTINRDNVGEIFSLLWLYSTLVTLPAIPQNVNRHLQFILLPSAFCFPALCSECCFHIQWSWMSFHLEPNRLNGWAFSTSEMQISKKFGIVYIAKTYPVNGQKCLVDEEGQRQEWFKRTWTLA